jgi:hypothetical protein
MIRNPSGSEINKESSGGYGSKNSSIKSSFKNKNMDSSY